MRAIYKKELRVFFKTSTGYVFTAIYLLLSGVYFYIINLVGQNGDIKVFFHSISSVLMFLIPILTMRSFSEEKRLKTDELLRTVSISSGSVVVGKFLSILTVFLIPTLITLIYPAILTVFGVHAGLVTMGNYFGLILLAGSFIAIGMFISSFTDSQVIAAIVSYAVLLISYLVATVGLGLSPVFRLCIQLMSLTAHFEHFTYGVFSLTDTIYYLSTTVLFLALSYFSIERERVA